MDSTTRESVFTEHQNILAGCIKRNLPLLLALRLELEDVAQDLSVRLLRSIERFDGTRCRSISLFLYHELQYEILDMRRRHKPYGMVGVPRDLPLDIVFLDHPGRNGEYPELPTDADYDCFLDEALETLPADERSVVIRKMNGEPIRKKVERECLSRARKTLAAYHSDYYSEGALHCNMEKERTAEAERPLRTSILYHTA